MLKVDADPGEVGLAAELIREQVLRHPRQEVPHSSAVLIDAFDESERAPLPGSKPGGIEQETGAASFYHEKT